MKLFRQLMLETATPEEIQIAEQELKKEFKNLNGLREEIKMNLLASRIRDIRMRRNQERINNTLVNDYHMNNEIGQAISKKLEEITALYHKLESDLASLRFQVNINTVDREKGKKELDILESKLERVKSLKIVLENALFHYNGLVQDLKLAIQEEIELKELYP